MLTKSNHNSVADLCDLSSLTNSGHINIGNRSSFGIEYTLSNDRFAQRHHISHLQHAIKEVTKITSNLKNHSLKIDLFGEKQTFYAQIDLEEHIFVSKSQQLGISSQGKTEEEAIENLKEAISLFFEDESPKLLERVLKENKSDQK